MATIRGLPTGARAHSTAFRRLVTTLKADGALSRAVRTWRCWEGTPGDADPPSVEQCPWVQLTPRPVPPDREAILGYGHTSLIASLAVDVKVATAGTDADDMLDLWGGLLAALGYRGDGAKFDAWRIASEAAGIQDTELSAVAWGVAPDGTMAVGTGTITLVIVLTT